MRKELRITGLGGQGAITVGHLLGRAAALYDNKEVVVTEGYSPYITGGWSRADLVISDKPIDYPSVSRLDVLVTMYQEGLELNLKLLKPSGLILTESRFVDSTGVNRPGKVFAVPAAELAEKLGKSILTNVVLLGALVACTGVVSMDSLKKTVAERFPKAAELNAKALDAGFGAIGAQGGKKDAQV